MSFKNFYAKNHQRYKQLYPFLKQSQLRMKIKQLWEKNHSSRSSLSLPSPKHAVDVSVERKRGSEDIQKGAQTKWDLEEDVPNLIKPQLESVCCKAFDGSCRTVFSAGEKVLCRVGPEGSPVKVEEQCLMHLKEKQEESKAQTVEQETELKYKATVLSNDTLTLQLSAGDTGPDLDSLQSSKCGSESYDEKSFDSQLSNTPLSSATNSIHSPPLSSNSGTNSIHSLSPFSASDANSTQSPSHSSLLCCTPGSSIQPSTGSSNSSRRRGGRGRHRKHRAPTDRHIYPKRITRSVSKKLKELEGEAPPTLGGAVSEPSPHIASSNTREGHHDQDCLCKGQELLALDETHMDGMEHPMAADLAASCSGGRNTSHGSHGNCSFKTTPAQIGQSTVRELLPFPPPPAACNGGELSCNGLRKETATQSPLPAATASSTGDIMCELFKPMSSSTSVRDSISRHCAGGGGGAVGISGQLKRTVVSASLSGINSVEYSFVENEDDIFMT